jgi:hypothetical protein
VALDENGYTTIDPPDFYGGDDDDDHNWKREKWGYWWRWHQEDD